MDFLVRVVCIKSNMASVARVDGQMLLSNTVRHIGQGTAVFLLLIFQVNFTVVILCKKNKHYYFHYPYNRCNQGLLVIYREKLEKLFWQLRGNPTKWLHFCQRGFSMYQNKDVFLADFTMCEISSIIRPTAGTAYVALYTLHIQMIYKSLYLTMNPYSSQLHKKQHTSSSHGSFLIKALRSVSGIKHD